MFWDGSNCQKNLRFHPLTVKEVDYRRGMIPLYPRHPIHDAIVPCKTDYFLIVSLPSYPEATKGANKRLRAVEETQKDAVILLQLLQEKKNKNNDNRNSNKQKKAKLSTMTLK